MSLARSSVRLFGWLADWLFAPPIGVQTVDGFCDRYDPASYMNMSFGVVCFSHGSACLCFCPFHLHTSFTYICMRLCMYASVRVNPSRLCAPLRLCLCALRLSKFLSFVVTVAIATAVVLVQILPLDLLPHSILFFRPSLLIRLLYGAWLTKSSDSTYFTFAFAGYNKIVTVLFELAVFVYNYQRCFLL